MTITNFPNGVSSFGVPLLGDIPPGGRVFMVDPARGSDGYEGTLERPLASIAAAKALMVADVNDVILYIAGPSGINLTEQLAWDLNYTHLIGLCAPTHAAQRARIFQAASAVNISPSIVHSATGVIWRNVHVFQGVNDADNLINVEITGGRNVFDNVHFAGGGHATQAVDGGMSLLLDGAEENLFRHCTIGVDTIDAADGMVGIGFDSEAHRNRFEDCIVRMRAGAAGAAWVEVLDATGIDRDNGFIRCEFYNNSATAMDSGFLIPAGMGAPRKIFLKDCMSNGAAKWDASDRGVLFGNMNAITGVDLSGAAVQMVT